MTPKKATFYDSNAHQLICHGDWDLQNLPHLKYIISKITWPKSGEVIINGSEITRMDSAGALLLGQLQAQLEKKGIKVQLQNFSSESERLISIVKTNFNKEKDIVKIKQQNWINKTGEYTIEQLKGLQAFLAFVGSLTFEIFRILPRPKHWRINAIANIIYTTGVTALIIVAMLSFMVGVVIAYQMGLQLRNYGANIYIVDLLGIAVLREFGPLLTAIMVAGRTGSSFTAQLGMMKINQEIDALNTLGVTPAELLLLPRMFGLFIVLPLLAIWSDFFGVFGGMLMANNMLNITFYDFLHRFPHVVKLKSLFLGLIKAPIFALIIASVGCFQGMQVKRSAESVGQNTTRSVVWAIFFIIVADAIFSIIFSKLNL